MNINEWPPKPNNGMILASGGNRKDAFSRLS
jgi:hypothetical protein